MSTPLSSRLLRAAPSQSTHLRQLSTTRPFLESPAAKTKISSNYNRPPAPRSRTTGQLPIAPLIAIFVLGSASFFYIVKSREGQGRPGGHQPIPDHAPTTKDQWPRNTASDQTLSRR